jgi:DNA (cytosine-5)-methyltransferase 1
MPTPKALDGIKGNLKTSQERLDAGFFVDLPNVANDLAESISWGKFEPAIRRWETVTGRPAPAPTKPDGKEDAHRLSSKFTEWMMGLPDGWITDCGLSRNEELKAAGNGVVPQQAEMALRLLLTNEPIPAGGGQVNLPTPTVSDTFTDNLASSQQKEGSMHSVTLPQAVRMLQTDMP